MCSNLITECFFGKENISIPTYRIFDIFLGEQQLRGIRDSEHS